MITLNFKMITNKKHIISIAVFICSFFLTPFISSAQIGEPCDVTDPFMECPIDGGISLLIATGVALGARRVKHQQKKQE